MKITNWVDLHYRRKWQWIQKIANLQDNRWSTLSYFWDTVRKHDKRQRGARTVTKFRQQWIHDFSTFWQETYGLLPEIWKAFVMNSTWKS